MKKRKGALDDVDFKILRTIQFHARISNVELAEKTGLSPVPCANRIRALEDAGVIEKYVAIFDQSAVGYPDTVLVEVALDRHEDFILEEFETALLKLPEVIEAYLTTGEYDYFIKVAVAGTDGYVQFLRNGLYKIPGILRSRSSFLSRPFKQTHSVNVDAPHAALWNGRLPMAYPAKRPAS